MDGLTSYPAYPQKPQLEEAAGLFALTARAILPDDQPALHRKRGRNDLPWPKPLDVEKAWLSLVRGVECRK